MSINENFRQDEIELITEAITTSNQERLQQLSNSVYMNVRKAVARNYNTDSATINKMAQTEITLPVLYWLLKNPASHVNRTISQGDLENKCVTCDISEQKLYSACMTCTK